MADVGDRARADDLVATAVKEFGCLDVLVNNAGTCPFREIFEIIDDVWMRTVNTNLYGPFVTSLAAARVMAVNG